VDDEEEIIQVGQLMLEKLGYRVLLARNGKEAIEIERDQKSQIDLVILDMIMPEMGGSETYGYLKELNPNIRVLLSSGYSLNQQAEQLLNRGCNGFIQKPFDLNRLSQDVRKVLDGSFQPK
jgi:CheY-like chemotaxis protein